MSIFEIVILNTKWVQIPQKVVYKKICVHEIAVVDLSKIYFLKYAIKACKPNNRDLNHDWINHILVIYNFKQVVISRNFVS